MPEVEEVVAWLEAGIHVEASKAGRRQMRGFRATERRTLDCIRVEEAILGSVETSVKTLLRVVLAAEKNAGRDPRVLGCRMRSTLSKAWREKARASSR